MLQVQINSVDKTDYIKQGSLEIENNLTNQVDSCSFIIVNYSGKTSYFPENEDEVVVYDDSDKIFGGSVVKITEKMVAPNYMEYKVECSDYTRLADRKLVEKVYEDETVEDIIKDIVDTYLSGFTYTNVSCTKTLDRIAFNYEPFSKCLKRLADMVGYDWYIDYDKDIHFFSKETNLSPFNLTDTNGNYIVRSLEIKRDTRQTRNVIYVRGAEYLADSLTGEIEADGQTRVFSTPYKMSDISVTVSGEVRTVGVDYVDDEDDYDCLYNFDDKTIKFKDEDKPSASKIVKYSGLPNVPLIVEVRDQESISEYGELHYRIIDKTIKSKDEARERGKAELLSYSDKLSEGSFLTHVSGLRSGQYINIQSDLRGLDEDFVINRVSLRMRNIEEFWYEVSIVTTKTFKIIEFLQKLLAAQDSDTQIADDETLDRLWFIGTEDLPNFLESTITFDYQSPPWYCATADPTGYVGFCQAS